MSNFATQLRAAGMTAEAAAAKAAQLEDLSLQVREMKNGSNLSPCAMFVPGRLEFLGKHTDYAGGRSIVCAIERGICMVLAARQDAHIRMLDVKRKSTAEFELNRDLEPVRGHWSNFPMTVARRMARDFPDLKTGIDVTFASDLPRASGMSSSSALVVATFFALARANALSQRDDYSRAIASREDLAAYVAAIESGASFGAFEGGNGVGTHGGSEDHVAILCSRAGFLRQYSYCPVRFEQGIRLPEDFVFAIAVSGVKADKTGDARDAYNRASATARQILELWRKATGRQDVSLAAAVNSAPDAIEKIGAIVRDSRDAEFSADILMNRLEQFVAESEEIVPAGSEALANSDDTALRETVDRSQLLAEKLLGNQVSETIELARSARQLGAIAASAFGAGFGGSVWALVRREQAEEFLQKWAEKYLQRFPDRADASEFFLSRPGPGLIEIH